MIYEYHIKTASVAINVSVLEHILVISLVSLLAQWSPCCVKGSRCCMVWFRIFFNSISRSFYSHILRLPSFV